MCLVDNHEVPADCANLLLHRAREVHRNDHDGVGVERTRIALAECRPERRTIQHHRWQVELLAQFECPLLPDGRRTDHEQTTLPLGPQLAEHQPCLDGLAEAHLVREQHALAQRRAEGEQRGVDLVWVQVNGGIEEGHG